jgi:CHASE2 domain-containing sensor protein
VFVGYGLGVRDGGVYPVSPPATLRPCLSLGQEAHTARFVEADDRVRVVPLFLENNPQLPALSLRIASALSEREGSSLRVPRSHLLQFSKPEPDIPTVSLETLLADPDHRDRLRARFLVVGEAPRARDTLDTFATPYGLLPGVMIHAYAANNLVMGTAIERGSTLPAVMLGWVIGIQVAIYAARGLSGWGLVGLGVLWSAGILALAALAVGLAHTWVDAVYELAAIWAMVAALIAWRAVARRGREQA